MLIAAVSVVITATIALARGEAATMAEVELAEHDVDAAPRELPSRDAPGEDDFGPFSDRLAVADCATW